MKVIDFRDVEFWDILLARIAHGTIIGWGLGYVFFEVLKFIRG